MYLLQIDSTNEFHISFNNPAKICNDRLPCNCSENVPPQIHLLKLVDGLCSITGNSQCSKAILSLFCNATTLYNDDDTEPVLTMDCIMARDNECAAEWRMVESFLNIALIDCYSFNDIDNVTLSRALHCNVLIIMEYFVVPFVNHCVLKHLYLMMQPLLLIKYLASYFIACLS